MPATSLSAGTPGASAAAEYHRRRARRPRRQARWWLGLAARTVAAVAAVAAGAGALAWAIDVVLRRMVGDGAANAVGREVVAAASLTAAVAVVVRGLRMEAHTERSWRVGSEGERIVARALAPLCDDGWVLLHDMAAPSGGNIDHVLVGPGGVWVVETKRWSGRLVVEPDRLRLNGRSRDAVLDQVWREARDVGRLLRGPPGRPRSTMVTPSDRIAGDRVFVRPALCVVGTELFRRPDASGRHRHGRVEVHTPQTLAARLAVAAPVLDDAAITALAGRLRRHAVAPAE